MARMRRILAASRPRIFARQLPRRHPPAGVLGASLLALLLLGAKEKPAAPASGVAYAGMSAEELDALKDQPLVVYLRSGKVLKAMQVVSVRPGAKPETLKDLIFKSADGKGSRRTLAASAIDRIVAADKAYLVLGDGKKDPWRLVDVAAREAKVAAYLRDKGKALWPKLTERERNDRVEKQKEFLDNVQADHRDRHFHLHETAFFLFYTDLPSKEVEPYIADLDKMYLVLSQAFGLASDENIWSGKAAVIAFADEKGFLDFEKKQFGVDRDGNQGLCHLRSDGDVLMSCYRGREVERLAALIVHETAQGFLFRYRSTVQLPAWVREGIADWAEASVVRGNDAVDRRQQEGASLAKANGSLGSFFEADQPELWQIGVASTMVDILVKRDAGRYRQLVEGIKEGQTWQDSLLTAFEMTPDDLAHLYGQRIGMPNLKP